MTTCPQTGKRCYRSPKAAKKASCTCHNRFRVYLCNCGYFHITSRVGGR